MKKIIIYCVISLSLVGCKDLFEPELQNNRELSDAHTDPIFAQGIMVNGYLRIPTNGWLWSDMATDNAVSRNVIHDFFLIASGEWASNRIGPVNMWNSCNMGIQYMNMVLSITDQVEYARNPEVDIMFKDRTKGEAYGLRALFMFHLLQAHAGYAGGQLLGVPIFTEVQDVSTDFNQPRATFDECIRQITNDVEEALKYLPEQYYDRTNINDVPEKYRSNGIDEGTYNRVFGNSSRQLISGNVVRAIRAQAALLAASPAYGENTSTSWNEAADYAAEVLNLNGGLSGIDPNGLNWFTGAVIDGIAQGSNPREILWRGDRIMGRSWEADHFPPTLFGNGILNPSQNLVDAFPMSNGLPISDSNSGYNPNNPYINRDPRLSKFILYNGGTAGPSNTVIQTALDATTNDGLNRVETSTRTGYYMRKLLRKDVNNNPQSLNEQLHLKPRIRYTEIYLAFAEAANEAWGPTGTGSHAYSAYDVIKAIRQRAQIGTNNGDAYLEQAKNSKDSMRELIRNERRLELCFEDFRFWDLRRWKSNLTEVARGMEISGGSYRVINVQNRVYENYMYYGPIPFAETLKYPALVQNDGWQ